MGLQKLSAYFSGVILPSIAAKLALIITAVVIGGMALLSLFILGNQNKILNQQADAYASALGEQLSIAAVEPLLVGDMEAMNQLTSNLAQNEGIEGIGLFSDQSQLLAAIGNIPEDDPAAVSSAKPLYWNSEDGNEQKLSSYFTTITFRDLTVGYSILTFNRSFMSAAYTSTLHTISAITALMLTLSIAVAVVLSRRLSHPVRQMVAGTKEISQGNYQFRFQDYRKDEFGQLMKSFNSMTKGLEEKDQVEQTFSRYVSPNVACTLLKDMDANCLGGRHVEATVLFADIVGFSKLSEEHEPEVINALLNDYFTCIDEVAGRHHGHIDKYIGDCAMILFGAPAHDNEHAIHAIHCGVEIQQVIEEYNRQRASQGKITVTFSVAVNSGTMLAGNMGSERRMEYTVIGDAVNLAARLSSLASSGQILVTKSLHDILHLETLYTTRLTKTVTLRGKTDPVDVWLVEYPPATATTPEILGESISPLIH